MIRWINCSMLQGSTRYVANDMCVLIAYFTVSVLKVYIITSAILSCRLLVVAPKTWSCSRRLRSNSIWSLALAFWTLRWAFWSSNSRNLLVTQSLIRAALASTAFASANRRALCKTITKQKIWVNNHFLNIFFFLLFTFTWFCPKYLFQIHISMHDSGRKKTKEKKYQWHNIPLLKCYYI